MSHVLRGSLRRRRIRLWRTKPEAHPPLADKAGGASASGGQIGRAASAEGRPASSWGC